MTVVASILQQLLMGPGGGSASACKLEQLMRCSTRHAARVGSKPRHWHGRTQVPAGTLLVMRSARLRSARSLARMDGRHDRLLPAWPAAP